MLLNKSNRFAILDIQCKEGQLTWLIPKSIQATFGMGVTLFLMSDYPLPAREYTHENVSERPKNGGFSILSLL